MFPLIPSRGSQIQYVTEWTPRANCRVLVRNARAAKSKCGRMPIRIVIWGCWAAKEDFPNWRAFSGEAGVYI